MAVHSPTSSNAARRPPAARVDWADRRVTVMGLGRHGGGVAAVRYLARRGARVTISDTARRASLSESLERLSDVPLAALKFGVHDPDDFRTDTVVVNPAVRPDDVCLDVARAWGACLTSEIELFLGACPAHVIGVTGTNGKSTTCSMLHAILAASGRRAWLGGNIGHSLLGDVESMTRDDWVVLELSSFQLAHLSREVRLPEMAVVTNCTPNHLDWHGSYDDYVAAKQRLVRDAPAPLPLRERAASTSEPGEGMRDPPVWTPAGPDNRSRAPATVVLGAVDAEVASWTDLAAGSSIFGWPLEKVPPLVVPGDHNRYNAACAAAAALAAGVERATIVAALASFGGLRHRLEFVGELAGRRFYDDSKSTSPQATIAALAAVEEPVWLLAGGHSKGANFEALAAAVAARARGAAVFGAASQMLRSEVQTVTRSFDVVARERLADAFDWCWARSRPGDAILLSPACASYDQFRDYRQRGEAFRALVARRGGSETL